MGDSAWGVLWVWQCMGQNWEQKKGETCAGIKDVGHEVRDPLAS